MVALSFGDDAVVAGEAGGLLRDHAEAGRVMVAPGDERGPRRRAEGGGVELRVAQPRLGDAVQRRRRDDAAEGARRTEAHVVGHDEQHVGRALGRHDARRPPRLRLQGVSLITPPNFGSGAGSCLPSMVVVAPGEPTVPVV